MCARDFFAVGPEIEAFLCEHVLGCPEAGDWAALKHGEEIATMVHETQAAPT